MSSKEMKWILILYLRQFYMFITSLYNEGFFNYLHKSRHDLRVNKEIHCNDSHGH